MAAEAEVSATIVHYRVFVTLYLMCLRVELALKVDFLVFYKIKKNVKREKI
jgi:hypothetical protein